MTPTIEAHGLEKRADAGARRLGAARAPGGVLHPARSRGPSPSWPSRCRCQWPGTGAADPHTTKGHTMTQNDMDTERYAELSMQWYGWGSPIGLGIGLIAIGGFVSLLALAYQLVT